ncbi:hypothetical protein A2956_02445 [Candidatus Roizmanbacteria bacterium RIFCSPLOWO2_01_FULL_37_57]|nr:MAG: hypothetical protein A2956_02445 [Candidatus Roizmanbacteria bacterium RIFCSPLOWO2_01_FULL_37_57]
MMKGIKEISFRGLIQAYIAVFVFLLGIFILVKIEESFLDNDSQKAPQNVESSLYDKPENTTQIISDYLNALNNFYVASIIEPDQDSDTIEIEVMRNFLNQNQYLQDGINNIINYTKDPNEIIKLSSLGMVTGAQRIIATNNVTIQTLKSIEEEEFSQGDMNLAIATHLSEVKEGYKMIAISAPQIGYLIFEPAKSKNPSGKIPYKITKTERNKLIEEINRQFGEDLHQDVLMGKAGEDRNAILFAVSNIRDYLVPNTYEEVKLLAK